MGGTFDPIHFGHLLLAERAREAAALDVVLWVPARNPPHKPGRSPAPAESRLEMVRLATAGHPAFAVSRVEVDREGPSFAIDTLDLLQRSHPGSELCFILGLDAALEIQTWHRYEEVIARCRLLVGRRPGFEGSLPPPLTGRFSLFEVPQIDVSSTEIRRRLAAGMSVRYMTPEAVQSYLEEHGLYRGAEPQDQGTYAGTQH